MCVGGGGGTWELCGRCSRCEHATGVGPCRQVTGLSTTTTTSPGKSEMGHDGITALTGHRAVKVAGAFRREAASEGQYLTELVTTWVFQKDRVWQGSSLGYWAEETILREKKVVPFLGMGSPGKPCQKDFQEGSWQP